MTDAPRLDARPVPNANQLRIQTTRLARRIASLELHCSGLERAVESFGGQEIDAATWQRVFDSHDPLDVVTRNGVTGCYSAVVNNYVELLKAGAYLGGLTTHRRCHAKDAIDAAHADGGITQSQAKHLHELFVFEGRLQHASPDVDASEVREAIELLRSEAVSLITAASCWLNRHGIEITARSIDQNP